jgi:hypothetical protein
VAVALGADRRPWVQVAAHFLYCLTLALVLKHARTAAHNSRTAAIVLNGISISLEVPGKQQLLNMHL